MMRGVLKLPWKNEHVPHAVLDILRGCNMRCRACYNHTTAAIKPLSQIQSELDILQQHRRLDSLSIAGGEPLLHPQLLHIIRMVKSRGISVELFTNGLCLTPAILRDLKTAGVDVLFVHIDGQQDRPDLGANQAINTLRSRLFAQVAGANLEAGLAITAYPDTPEDTHAAIEFVLTSPHVDYLLATLHRPSPSPEPLTGSLDVGLRCNPPTRDWLNQQRQLTNHDIARQMHDRFGLSPFAFIPSIANPDDPRWLTYLTGVVIAPDGTTLRQGQRVSVAERLFLAAHRRLTGRYPFFMPHSQRRLRMQLLANALTGGHTADNLRLLFESLRPGRQFRTKRLLFQWLAQVDATGRLVHCDHCPDATVVNGKLVPVCVCDDLVPSTIQGRCP